MMIQDLFLALHAVRILRAVSPTGGPARPHRVIGRLGAIRLNIRKTASASLTSATLVFLGLALATSARADVASGLTEFRAGRFAEALQTWRQAADAGDARGALFVGVVYDTGQGAPQDASQALAWYRRAAEAGSAAGAFNLAVMYDSGHGVPPDSQEAANWYARAAAKGYARAEYNLGLMYEAGTGVKRDRSRAIGYFSLAAEHGIPAARPHLARLGAGAMPAVAAIPGSAEDAAMGAFQKAQKALLTRGPGEAEQAVVLFRRAAEQHNSLAEYDLGYCYEHGLGVSRDLSQAFAWYRRAASDATDESLRSMASMGVRNLEGQSGEPRSRDAGSANTVR